MFLLRPPYLLRRRPFFERKNVCNSQENGVCTRRAAIINHYSKGKSTTRSKFTTRCIVSTAGSFGVLGSTGLIDSALKKHSGHPKYGWNGMVSGVFPHIAPIALGPFFTVLRGQPSAAGRMICGRKKAHKHKLFALVNVQMALGQTAGCPRVIRAKKFMCSPRNTGNITFPSG